MGRKSKQNRQQTRAKKFVPKFEIQGKDSYQKAFIKNIKSDKIVVFGIGAAGTGKTLLALNTTLSMMFNDFYPQTKLFYLRSNTQDKDETPLGSMPGDLLTKVDHLAFPLYDNISKIISKEQLQRLVREEAVTIGSMGFLRGRTFENTFLIVDEAQNCTYAQIKKAISRIGENSKIILIGDPSQKDIVESKSGYLKILDKVKHLKEIGHTRLRHNYRRPELKPVLDII